MAQRFIKPAVEVEAMQFVGLGNLHEILTWLGGIFYVDKGLDSEHRFAAEYDDEVNIRPDAPPFGIIKTRTGYDRVDIGDWIVRYDQDRVTVYDSLDFALKFEEVGHEQSGRSC